MNALMKLGLLTLGALAACSAYGGKSLFDPAFNEKDLAFESRLATFVFGRRPGPVSQADSHKLLNHLFDTDIGRSA